mmetsp:Transcript_63968/g.161203  ORF Transcript_63968/g.161203 Transcript_63968/m.161203 type:complete len:371 (+) Transcript_63968:44-1156(+)
MTRYTTIEGKKCEADLLKSGEKLTRDAALSLEGARSIWEEALDGNKVTVPERNAIAHIMKNAPHGMTNEAETFLRYWLDEKEVSQLRGGDVVKVDGVRCDGGMIKVIEHFQKFNSGPLGIRAAEGVWFSALDGRGVTRRERETIDIILRKYSFDDSGRRFLESKISWLTVAADALAAGGEGSHTTTVARVTSAPDAIILSRADAMGLELALLTPPSNSARLSGAASTAPSFFSGEDPPPKAIGAASTAPSGSGEEQPSSSSRKRRSEDESAEQPAKRLRDGSKVSLDSLRAIFDKCDLNSDGRINKREFIKACRQDAEVANFFEIPQNIRQEDGSRTRFEEKFQDMDKDSDREIRWAELLAYYRHRVVDV